MSQHTEDGTVAPSAGLSPDLKPRIISAAVLAGVARWLTYAGTTQFAGLVILVALLMSWEWARVVRGQNLDFALLVHAVAVVAACVAAVQGVAALGMVILMIGAVIVLLVQAGHHGRLSCAGVLYVGFPAVSLLWMRTDEPYGFPAVLFILLVVWMTDTGAYFGGRLIGGAKLWPSVSPNKTWAGLISGIAAGAVTGALFAFLLPNATILRLGLGGLILGLVSQMGDLAESALKRSHGVKDASALIPGHGGFLDRVDGVVFAACFAALLALALNMQEPAHALLFWG
jgi:phosphatidate cytidylyltransferase